MGKKLNKIEKYVYVIIVIMFFIVIFKYIVKNNIYKYFDPKLKIAEEQISKDLILNIEYNKTLLTPKKTDLAFSGELYSSGGVWILSGTGAKNFRVFNNDGYIGIESKNKENNWYIDFDGIEKYYPMNNTIKLDAKYNKGEDSFKIYEQEDSLPIYGYHSVIEDNAIIEHPTLEIKETDFDNQINYLTNELGCRWFTLSYLAEEFIKKNIKVPKKACVINFDDGRKNNFTIAYPIYKKYGVVGTFYIIIDLLGKGEYMTTQEASILYRNGNEMGSHTLFGGSLVNPTWFLIKVGRAVTKQDIYEQIKGSKDKLESRGYIVKTFAYPLGQWNEEIVNMIKESGYIGARDISRGDLWRDRRTQTVSYEDDRIRHLNYIKPENLSLADLKNRTGYNTWWQFEDGNKIINSKYEGSVRELATMKPTENSYGVMSLGSGEDEISNKFIISGSGSYTINVYGSTGNHVPDDMFDSIVLKVDGKIRTKILDVKTQCVNLSERFFCNYQTIVDLDVGVHTLNIANSGKWTIYVDKFNIFRNVNYKNKYNLKILKD